VALFERCKGDDGNLGFIPRGYGVEGDHLDNGTVGCREELKARVRELSEKGMRQVDIANQLGITQCKVSRLLNS